MGRAVVLWFVLAAVSGTAVAQESDAWCYPSGLKVAAVERQGSPVVGLAAVVDGGSSAELPEEAGAAHLVEHLWFRSPRLGAPSVDAMHASIGAEANGTTTHDETTYLTVAPKRAIRALIQAEAERLLDPIGEVTPEIVATEQRVVQAELAERFEGQDPAARAVLALLVPPDHAYARSVGGTLEQVAALTEASLRAYASRTYLAKHTTLYVTGDLPPAAVRRLVEQSLAPDLLGGDPDPCLAIDDTWPELPADPASGRRWVERPTGVDGPLSVVAWALPGGFAGSDLADAATSLMSWRFWQRGIEASCEVLPLRELTLVTCEAPTRARRDEAAWARALRAAVQVWRQARRDAVPAHTQYWSGVTSYLERRHQRDAIGSAEVLVPGGYLDRRALEFHRSRGAHQRASLDFHDVAAFGATWLTRSRASRAHLVPLDGNRALSSGFHAHTAARSAELAPAGELTVERLAEVVVDPGLAETLTDERARVWVLESPTARLFRISAVYLVDPAVREEVLDHAWRLLQATDRQLPSDGPALLTKSGSAVVDERRDTYWARTVTSDDETVVTRLFDRVLGAPVGQVSRSVARAARVELEAWLDEHRAEPDAVAGRARWTALADGAPHPLWDDPPAHAPARTRDEARGVAEGILAPGPARLVAVVPTGAGERVRAALAGLPGAVAPRAIQDNPPTTHAAAAPRSVTVIAAERDGPQAALSLECHVVSGDAAGWWVVERALRQALWDEVRNDLGLTYGVYLAYREPDHGPTLAIDTRVPHDAAGPTARGIFDALDGFASGSTPRADLDRLKLEVARETALKWQDPRLVLAVLQEAAAVDHPPEDLGLATRIHAVDAGAIASRLAPCAGHEALTIVGDPDVVGASLDAAGLSWTLAAP